jgi:hypothetical protein
MRNEMDLLNMDERQRLAWFMANRGTLIAVGSVWIGMIGWELTHGRVPAFLLVMVPVFALLRAGLYLFYSSRPFAGSYSERDPRLVRYGKVAAALLLVTAAFLPIYSVGGAPGEGASPTYAWGLVADDAAALPPLAFAYLWPVLVLGLSRLRPPRSLQVTLQFAEPVLAVASSIIMLWIPQLIFETRVVFFIPVVLEPTPQWGCYLAVAANCIYTVSWLAGLLTPWPVQEG